MQILKDELRDRIYDSAVNEFKEKGFKGASLRNIAKASGMTVGNLYRYYKSKEALFDAVINSAYAYICNLIDNHECPKELEKHGDNWFLDFMTDKISELFMQYRDELIVLVDCSEGTKYHDVKEKFIEMIAKKEMEHKHINELPIESGDVSIEEYERFMVNIVARSYVEGLINIFRTYKEREKFKFFVSVLQQYCFSDIFNPNSAKKEEEK